MMLFIPKAIKTMVLTHSRSSKRRKIVSCCAAGQPTKKMGAIFKPFTVQHAQKINIFVSFICSLSFTFHFRFAIVHIEAFSTHLRLPSGVQSCVTKAKSGFLKTKEKRTVEIAQIIEPFIALSLSYLCQRLSLFQAIIFLCSLISFSSNDFAH